MSSDDEAMAFLTLTKELKLYLNVKIKIRVIVDDIILQYVTSQVEQ